MKQTNLSVRQRTAIIVAIFATLASIAAGTSAYAAQNRQVVFEAFLRYT